MNTQEVVICNDLHADLQHAVQKCPHDKLFILTDENTYVHCLPLIDCPRDAIVLKTGAEDIHKNLETLSDIWLQLSKQGATRH